MRTTIYFLLIVFCFIFFNIKNDVNAQGVGIGNPSFDPVSSAILELRSEDKGFLVPRISWTSKPTSPVDGVMIYVEDDSAPNGNGFYYYDANSTTWIKMGKHLTAGTGITIDANGVVINTAPDQAVNVNAGSGITVSGAYPDFTVTNDAPDQAVNINAGSGITVSGTYPNYTVTNDSPGEEINLTAGSGISLSGTYPDITVTNTAPDQAINITGTGSTTVTGTYPNYTINSTGTTYNAGTGLSLTGNTFTNTAPDQTVSIAAGTGVSVSGTYPNFTVTNTEPDQNVNISAGAGITVTGTYPNYTVTNNTPGTDYTAGTGIDISGSTINSVWTENGANIYNNNTGNVGLGITNPTHDLHIYKNENASIKIGNSSSHRLNKVFFGDGAYVWVGENGTDDQLELYSGTMKIRTAGGYGTDGQVLTSDGSTCSWQDLPESTSIDGTGSANHIAYWENATDLTYDNSQLYWDPTNNRMGIGTSTPTEELEVSGDIKLSSTTNRVKMGTDDIIRVESMGNNFFGQDAGNTYSSGNYNTFMGYSAGRYISSATGNTMMGFNAGRSNSTSHLTGDNNTLIGSNAAVNITSGEKNSMLGSNAGQNNSTGTNNVYLGHYSGIYYTSGNQNTFVGAYAGGENTGTGTGSENTFLGFESGYKTKAGTGNVFLGYRAGYNETGSNKLYIDNSNTSTPLIYGDFTNNEVTINGDLAISNDYLNFSTTIGSAGFGLRENAGVIEYKNSGGSWTPFPTMPSIPGNTEYWVRPTGANYIHPAYNSNARVYDNATKWGYYYKGSNTVGSFFGGLQFGLVGVRGGTDTTAVPNPTSDVFPWADSNGDGSCTDDDQLSYTGIYGYGASYVGITGIGELDAGIRGIALGRSSASATNSGWPVTGVIGEVIQAPTAGYGQQGIYGWQAGPAGTSNYCQGVVGRTSQSGTQSAGIAGYYTPTVGSLTNHYSSSSSSSTNYGLVGTATHAGYFKGDVHVTGSLSKGAGSFLIDHPDDPENKTLRHNFVESDENLCMYRGSVKLNENGEGKVAMPDYFKSLVKEDEATVNLTPIGRPFMTGYEWDIENNSFIIYGDANREVSYIVLADRDDPVMKELYRPVVEEKGKDSFVPKGKLLYPEAYGFDSKKAYNYENVIEEIPSKTK